MKVIVSPTAQEMAGQAAASGDGRIRDVLKARSECNTILATGNSQLEVLSALVRQPGIDWGRVNAFHLDEYIGLPLSHLASFRLYLWKQFVSLLPLLLASFHYIDGETDPAETCRRFGEEIRRHPIDVAFVGIGENGHLAFNDPPADFVTTEPYLVVDLDEDCRKQQLAEGWFPTLGDVPMQAISMSVRQIMSSHTIICSAPDERKADAVRDSAEGPVTPSVPASILQKHPNARLYLDGSSASRLRDQN